MVETGCDRFDRQNSSPCGNQLERERETFETATDRREGLERLCVRFEILPLRTEPISEERD
jgi:hypothetical protein